MGAVYDSGDYEKALDHALNVAGWEQRDRDAARADGRLVGLGLSMYVEGCGLGPSSTLPPGGWEHSQVTVERDGRISATTGASPHGQGNETTFAQMLADQFGVPLDHVTIHHGDTAVVKHGIGTFGSRSQAVGGAALHDAGTKVKAKMAKFAAALLEAHESDLVFENGTIAVKGAPASAKPFAEVAAYAYRPIRLPEGLTPGLSDEAFFEPKNHTYPFGCHIAMLEVDRETGEPRLLKMVAVDAAPRHDAAAREAVAHRSGPKAVRHVTRAAIPIRDAFSAAPFRGMIRAGMLPRRLPASSESPRETAADGSSEGFLWAMARVPHPALAEIHGVESWRGRPFLVVEFLRGGTLADRLRNGPVPGPEAVVIAVGLAEALAALHGAGYLHGDVKPSNIGFTADGLPKLLDFGLARGPNDLKVAGGTLLYLSPEVLNGRPANEADDVWSLCVVLYEMVSGEHPFMGDNVDEVVDRIRNQRVSPGARPASGSETSSPVAALAASILTAPRAARPATARTYADMLGGVLTRSGFSPQSR